MIYREFYRFQFENAKSYLLQFFFFIYCIFFLLHFFEENVEGPRVARLNSNGLTGTESRLFASSVLVADSEGNG